MKIGIQMFSLRNYIPKAGLAETLRNIKKAGFDCIEPIYFDYGLGMENVGKAMREHGLCAPGMHIPYEITAEKSKLAELKDIFGIETAVIPFIDAEDMQDTARLTDMLSLAARNTRELGLKLAYHNHAHEFENGGSPARLCDLCPDLKLQVDVFWVKAAGITPLEFLRDNAERVASIHMKEFGAAVNAPEPVVGDGSTDAKAVLEFAEAQGHSCITLEYEHTDMDEIEYITRSLDFMRKALK